MKTSALSWISLAIALLLHLCLLLYFQIPAGEGETKEDPAVFKLVDVELYTPPPQPLPTQPPPPSSLPSQEQVQVPPQDTVTERVEETEKQGVELPAPPSPLSPPPTVSSPIAVPSPAPEIEYLPQHKISIPPRIPVDQVLRKIVYPPQANLQRIEGVVYLELYIDREGVIRKIEVLKDPGYGFAEAAVKAFEGVRCQPAEANGVPVAVRYRYPIRFKLR
ncbi:MAG: energy transducer TonB [Spirochaetes bacterium]|nr:energy transducer TonB [Spirochaetota bacterium]